MPKFALHLELTTEDVDKPGDILEKFDPPLPWLHLSPPEHLPLQAARRPPTQTYTEILNSRLLLRTLAANPDN